jgi:hypothetical protein
MAPLEIAANLLAFSASLDPKAPQPSQTTLIAWSKVLGYDRNLTIEDAEQAISDHYARTNETIMPANIIQGVQTIRHRREGKNPKPYSIDACQQIQHQNNQRGTKIVAQHMKWTNQYKKIHGKAPTAHEADQHIRELRTAA